MSANRYCRLRSAPPTRARRAAEILVHVRNYTAKAARVPLALSLGDRQILREEIEIERRRSARVDLSL